MTRRTLLSSAAAPEVRRTDGVHTLSETCTFTSACGVAAEHGGERGRHRRAVGPVPQAPPYRGLGHRNSEEARDVEGEAAWHSEYEHAVQDAAEYMLRGDAGTIVVFRVVTDEHELERATELARLLCEHMRRESGSHLSRVQ